MKKIILIVLIIILIALGIWLIIRQPNDSPNLISQCQFQKMTYYYLEGCGWCQRIESEETVEKVEALGVRVNKINLAISPMRNQIQSVPTFVINREFYRGYKTFEELKDLLGCPREGFNEEREQAQI